MKNILLILLFFLAIGCRKELAENEFEVKVIGKLCNLPVIEFKAEDAARVNSIAGYNDNQYCAYFLDEKFSKQGKHLIVVVTDMNQFDLMPCNTMEYNYPPLRVLKANFR